MAYIIISYYICNPEITAMGTSRCWYAAVCCMAFFEKMCGAAESVSPRRRVSQEEGVRALPGEQLLTAFRLLKFSNASFG